MTGMLSDGGLAHGVGRAGLLRPSEDLDFDLLPVGNLAVRVTRVKSLLLSGPQSPSH